MRAHADACGFCSSCLGYGCHTRNMNASYLIIPVCDSFQMALPGALTRPDGRARRRASAGSPASAPARVGGSPRRTGSFHAGRCSLSCNSGPIDSSGAARIRAVMIAAQLSDPSLMAVKRQPCGVARMSLAWKWAARESIAAMCASGRTAAAGAVSPTWAQTARCRRPAWRKAGLTRRAPLCENALSSKSTEPRYRQVR
jgi:hypothetical protein